MQFGVVLKVKGAQRYEHTRLHRSRNMCQEKGGKNYRGSDIFR